MAPAPTLLPSCSSRCEGDQIVWETGLAEWTWIEALRDTVPDLLSVMLTQSV